ncbi:MAG: tRNA (5-methylaminomethyl-2-thiouridylate)-methyltransferase, partial [Cetobacterium sp.]
IRGKEVPGPHMIGFGELSEGEINFALNLFSRYSKVKGNSEVTFLMNNEDITIPTVNFETLNEEIAKYQITM